MQEINEFKSAIETGRKPFSMEFRTQLEQKLCNIIQFHADTKRLVILVFKFVYQYKNSLRLFRFTHLDSLWNSQVYTKRTYLHSLYILQLQQQSHCWKFNW